MESKNYLFLLFICLASACIPQQAEQAASPTYTIAYNVLINPETDDYEIFTMNMDGSEKKNITNHPGLDWTYYAFEDKIFFISDRDSCKRCYYLYEMDVDGNHVRKISDTRLADSWMGTRKEGSEIIVKPHSSVDSAFYIIDLQGRVLDKIYNGLPYANDPIFVHGGTSIAFRGNTKKSRKEEGFMEEIYLMDLESKSVKQLSHYPARDTTAPWYAYKAGPPILQPKENFISYQSMQAGKYSLFGLSLDGSKQWKLTENVQNEGWHSWSPDGRWLGIELFDAAQSQFHIGLMDWKTKEMKILTDTSYQYQQVPVFVTK